MSPRGLKRVQDGVSWARYWYWSLAALFHVLLLVGMASYTPQARAHFLPTSTPLGHLHLVLDRTLRHPGTPLALPLLAYLRSSALSTRLLAAYVVRLVIYWAHSAHVALALDHLVSDHLVLFATLAASLARLLSSMRGGPRQPPSILLHGVWFVWFVAVAVEAWVTAAVYHPPTETMASVVIGFFFWVVLAPP